MLMLTKNGATEIVARARCAPTDRTPPAVPAVPAFPARRHWLYSGSPLRQGREGVPVLTKRRTRPRTNGLGGGDGLAIFRVLGRRRSCPYTCGTTRRAAAGQSVRSVASPRAHEGSAEMPRFRVWRTRCCAAAQ